MKNAERIQTIKKSHPFKLWDLCVYVIIVVAAVFLIIAASKPQGNAVLISYYNAAGKQVVIEKALGSDGVFEVPLPDGEHCVIVIEGGKVWVKESDCKDKVCIGMGKISRVNQQIVCLPYRIMITITGGGDEDIIIS